MTVAQNYVKNCPRCFRAINKGDRIEKYARIDGQTRWAHVGCKGRPRVEAAEGRAPVSSENAARLMEAMRGALGGSMNGAVISGSGGMVIDEEPEAGGPTEIREGVTEEFIRSVAREAIREEMGGIREENDMRMEALMERVEIAAAAKVVSVLESRVPVEVVHTFNLPERGAVRLEGEVLHPKFDRLIRLALAGKPIFLPGPTGCGKTHTAMQLARVLNRPFGMLSCSPGMTESQILGRSVPKVSTGEEVYRVSEFVKLFENGGVFLFDEMDAADPSVLLVINAALANGKVPVPNRPELPIAERHPDFVCVAAANTWGTGANREYVGRNPLDEATLDRFRIGTVPCDYVEAIERAICPDAPLYRKLKGWREKMREAGVKRIISTRFFKDAFDMKCAGDEMADIEMALFGGWKGEEVVKVLGRTIR